jgi:3-oxoacyl-[acyl-carrier protein] reductase
MPLTQTFGAYAATKAAVDIISKTAARELGPRGIRVNVVSPGVIPTDMAKTLPDEAIAQFKQQTPLENRLGTPDEVADTVAYLASPQASWVTAQIIELGGGI